jgi:hypothetical protein
MVKVVVASTNSWQLVPGVRNLLVENPELSVLRLYQLELSAMSLSTIYDWVWLYNITYLDCTTPQTAG